MRQNGKKPKANANNNPRRNVRSTSIRSIIGDRRFDQFRRVNNDGVEGTKKAKGMKDSDAEAHDLPNLGSETAGDSRGGCGDLAAKTSEYAFFKRIKENTCSNNVHEDSNCHDNELSKVQHRHSFTRAEIPNVQKDSIKYAKTSSPNEEEQNEAHYSFISPPCRGSKNSAVDGTNVHNARPGLHNCLSPSVGSKIKTWGDKGGFSAKREKLRRLAADRSLFNVNDLSSEGFDLVSALISRILPVVQDNNTHKDPNQDEIGSEYKLPPFSELESVTQIKNHEAYKRKLMESQKISYFDDGFCRPRKQLEEKNLLEWNPTDSFPCDDGFRRPTKKPKEKNLLEWNPTESFSCDDGFCRPTKKLKEKNLLEWNPTESFSCGPSPSYRIRYNRCQTEGYNREIIKSPHRSCLDILEWNPNGIESSRQYNHNRTASDFRIQNFDMESILSFDDPLPVHESNNFQEFDESRLYTYTEPKLLERPQRLLLGWDHNSEKDESFLTSSPYITRHIRKEHLLASSISPCTPKHLMAVEDCSIKFPFQDYNTWRLNESLNKEENCGSESFLFLIQSPASKPLSLLGRGLHSLVDDENEENFVYGSDQFLNSGVNGYSSSSYMGSFFDKRFDHTDYPLLIHDSSRNDEF